MKVTNKPQRIMKNPGRIGYTPSADKTGMPAVNAQNSLNLISNARQIFASNCYPQSLFGRADASDTDYYIVTRFPRHTVGTSQRLYAGAVLAEHNHASEGSVTWYPSYAPGSLGTGHVLATEPVQADFGTLYDGRRINVKNRTVTLVNDNFTATQVTSSADFELGLLRFDHMFPIALGVFAHGPRSDSPSTTNIRPKPTDCAAGAMIRGHDSSLYREGLGDLIYKTCTVDQGNDFLTSAIAAPVFSYGVPGGIWSGAFSGGADTRNIFGVDAPVRLRVRSPFQDATVKLRPTVVYSTGSAGTYSISVTNYLNSTGAATAVLTTNTANPTLTTFSGVNDSNDLEATKNVESSVLVEVTLDNADGDNWVIIHSIALWPEYDSTVPPS